MLPWSVLTVLCGVVLTPLAFAQTSPPPTSAPVNYGVINIKTAKLLWDWSSTKMPKIAAWVIYCGATSGTPTLRKEIAPTGRPQLRETLVRRVTRVPGKYVCTVAVKPVADIDRTESAKSNEVAFEIPVPGRAPVNAKKKAVVK